jgi:ATP-dependent RNA helicase RhlE
MKFEDYHFSPELKRNLELLGFKRPTDIQFKCIPHVLKNEDVLAIAQTGTGKTAAFVLPIIHLIQKSKKNSKSKVQKIHTVVLVPTRELCLQIKEVVQSLAKGTKIRVAAIYGGVEQDPQIAKMAIGVDILICTPGRLFDLIHQEVVDISQINTLVIDEADKMLALGFYKDISDLLKLIPSHRQTLFFSATINKNIKKLAYSLVRNAIRIQISPKDPVSKNVTHHLLFVEMDDKRFFLKRVIEEHPDFKFLVFVRTKVRAERVKLALERMDISAMTIHGDKTQEEREETLQKFKEGGIKILITTDVTARGIDIPNIDYVINYDMPDIAENYVHRVGRTGRAKARGLALSFCSKEEKPMLEEIENYMGVSISRASVSNSEYEETIDFLDESKTDWKSLMVESEISKPKKKKKK